MFTVGTAGHVDHGKSALVKALTGTDPDRLVEEKERGMTTDLGFAWLRLPSGQEVGLVDVPGHERFIKNMLAGVGGIDAVILVIAADEGVMPQTREHLAILDLLRVRGGVVALTKRDLVETEWLELVSQDVQETLLDTVLEDAPIVPVSAVTGEGMEELKIALDSLLAKLPARHSDGRPRLPVDRVFSVAGFGTVVTGTLGGGDLRVGQELEVLPEGIRTRARGLQVHGHKVDTAAPGGRVAVNLGGVSTTEVARGNVVASPGWLTPTGAVDAHVKVLKDAKPVRHGTTVTVFAGAAESAAKLRLLDADVLEPGQSGWAQLRLEEPMLLARGDLFIIRSTEETLGGGEVVDPTAKRHKRFQESVLGDLESRQSGGPDETLLRALDVRSPISVAEAARRSGLSEAAARDLVARMSTDGRVAQVGDGFVAARTWLRLEDEALGILRDYHRQYPLRQGMPREELKSRLPGMGRAFAELATRLAQSGRLVEEPRSQRLRLPEHEVRIPAEKQAIVDRLLAVVEREKYSPPSVSQIKEEIPFDDELLEALVQQGQLARVGENLVFAQSAYQSLTDIVLGRLKEKGSITVGEVRDLLDTSRKYSLAILEHFDELKLTKRVGDERVPR